MAQDNNSADSGTQSGKTTEAVGPRQQDHPLASAPHETLIFLFSSVPRIRPNYKRGVLDALCYPSGHILELSYKKSDIEPSLAGQLGSLVQKPAIFVFVDYDGANDKFVPVRYATILTCEPQGNPKKITERTRIYIRIELGSLIRIDPDWDRVITAMPNSPIPGKRDKNQYYVSQHDVPVDRSEEYSQADIWDDLVDRISQASVLDACIFLKTTPLREFVSDQECVFAAFGRTQKAYKLRPNHLYKMDLRIFDRGNKPDTNQEIYIRSSSDLIIVSQPFATAIGGPVEHTVLLVCKRSIENTLATLVMDVRDSGASPPTASGTDGVKEGGVTSGPTPMKAESAVICAKPRYLLNVSVSRAILGWFVVLVFLGVLFTSTSVEFFKEVEGLLSCLPGTPPVWGLAAKIIGAIFLSLAAYLGFRKLPSGSPGG